MSEEAKLKGKKNFLITGPPSSGKTTIIKKTIELLPVSAKGFYTEAVGVKERHLGFELHSLTGETGRLSHPIVSSDIQMVSSDFYLLNYDIVDSIAIPAMIPNGEEVIVIDEIANIAWFSDKFILAARQALDSPKIVIGTITLNGKPDFTLEVKQRSDVEIMEVTIENRDQLPEIIVKKVMEYLVSKG
jgi:nucleoside-triphosphatase THEP1